METIAIRLEAIARSSVARSYLWHRPKDHRCQAIVEINGARDVQQMTSELRSARDLQLTINTRLTPQQQRLECILEGHVDELDAIG